MLARFRPGSYRAWLFCSQGNASSPNGSSHVCRRLHRGSVDRLEDQTKIPLARGRQDWLFEMGLPGQPARVKSCHRSFFHVMRQTGVKAPNNVLVVLQSRASLYRGASRTVGPQTHTRRLSMRFWLFEAAKRRTAAGGEAEDLLYRARGSFHRGLGEGRENSLRSWALAVRRVS